MGGEYDLALPLGALEDVARVAPKLEQLYVRIVSGEWTLQEIRAVMEAAIKWSPDATGLTFAGLVDYEGMARLRLVSGQLFEAAWLSHEDRKKLDAPAEASPTGATGGS